WLPTVTSGHPSFIDSSSRRDHVAVPLLLFLLDSLRTSGSDLHRIHQAAAELQEKRLQKKVPELKKKCLLGKVTVIENAIWGRHLFATVPARSDPSTLCARGLLIYSFHFYFMSVII